MSKESLMEIEKVRVQYNANLQCLLMPDNFRVLVQAKKNHDYCAIQGIFEKCGVPRDQWQYLMDEIFHCPRAPW